MNNYIVGSIFLVVSLINFYKYFKMQENVKNYISVISIVTYVNCIFVRNRYKTFCTYKYEYLGNTYEAYDRGYGKNLKKLNEEVNILINPNKPNKYVPPMKYNDRNRYILFGIIWFILFILIVVQYFIYK